MAGRLRSCLFVPGHRPDRFAKALDAGADAVIVDLEDAVAPQDKDAARDAVLASLPAGRHVYVRVNAAGSPWFERDLDVCAVPSVRGIVLPKAERSEDVERIAGLRAGLAVLPLVETAAGLDNVDALVRARGVRCLLLGTLDLAFDLRVRDDDAGLLYARSRLVVASRVAERMPPVDGVCTSLDDADALRRHAQRARDLGFGGVLCIHPRQVAVVNAVFSPSADEVAWSRKVVAAAEAAGGGAVSVDGRMVDRPVVERARAVLRDAEGDGTADDARDKGRDASAAGHPQRS
ncbi:MAG TPA: CoA ester lyase [Casimicrobiaceae bacterium]|nr:CoA ester lyase [Casimicrobiaceae bacterium]